MSRRASVVAGIVECLQPDRGGWELIDSHGAGTVVCPFTTGRGIGTETCEMDNVCFLLTTSSLAWTLVIICSCVYIYIYIVFGSLISDLTCNYVSADGGTGGLPFPGTRCPIPDVDNLCLFRIDFNVWGAVSILTTSLGCFVHGFCFSNNGLDMSWISFTCYAKGNQQGGFGLSN